MSDQPSLNIQSAATLPHTVHIIGIGGAGMAALAEILLALGCQVSGSDLKENIRTQRLSKLGLKVLIGHSPDNLQDAEVVVHSTAIPPENVELRVAKAADIPVWNRAALLKVLSSLKSVIAVAGTHGKTTTASMLSLILMHARLNPSFVIGGDVNEVGSGACWNTGSHFVVEADESDGSFLALNPTHTVITSIDPDHHTRYGSFEALCQEFWNFLKSTGQTAVIHTQALVCLEEHISLQEARAHSENLSIVSYGTQPEADYQITNFVQTGISSSFSVNHHGQLWADLSLPVPGLHNAENALAALLAAQELGVSLENSAKSLLRFAGISRRFEFRGTTAGVTFIDDYAHLPAEVSAAVAAASAMAPSRLVCVFQPHRYSRLKNLWKDFSNSFDGVDTLVAADVYSAGEMPLPGVTGELIVQAVSAGNGSMDIKWAPRLDDVVKLLRQELKAGDLCLVLGAGDIHLVIDQLKNQNSKLSVQPHDAGDSQHSPKPTSLDSRSPSKSGDHGHLNAQFGELRKLLPDSEVSMNWPLGQHTSYRVGGAASLAVKVNTHSELARLAVFVAGQTPELPVLVLGNGTNMLVSDTGFRGLVIRLGEEFSKIRLPRAMQQATKETVRFGAACSLPVAARQSATAGLSGFEWAVGVPGSVGGAVRMNAGGHGSNIAESLRSAICIDLRSGLLETLQPEDLQLGYRSSALKLDQIVCEASIELTPADPNRSKQMIAEIIRWRREHQPGGQNCGSVFTNPQDSAAGALIDQLGLKGKRVGTAGISSKHANFIIADRNGSAEDVFRLMCEVAETVRAKTGIQLKSETVLVGFDHLVEELNLLAGRDNSPEPERSEQA